MQLTFDRGRWEAATRYGEPVADVLKVGGFRWDRNVDRWHSSDAMAALKFRDYADDATKAKLDEAAVVAKVAANAKAKAAAEAVAASRATDSAIHIPAPVGLSYLPFQRAGIVYASARKDTLIADEPGLGKTIQALGVANVMLSERAGNLSILIVAPKIALWNWSKETAKWLTRTHSIAIWTAKKQTPADVVIVNYDVLARPAVAEALRVRNWDMAVFDEAHALKNAKSARAKAVFGSSSRDDHIEPIRAGRRLFLTGTPILNRPVELFPILHSMGMPEAQSYWDFAKRYCSAYRTNYGLDVSGASNLVELQSLTRAFAMVRRLKADVLTELPPKRFAVVELEADTPDLRRAISAEQTAKAASNAEEARLSAAVKAARAGGSEAAVKAAVAALKSLKLSGIAEISKLRHDTAVAKVPQVVEHITAVLDGGEESILVMAHHQDVVSGIVAGLAAAGHEAAVITGSTSEADRVRAQEDIQSKRKRVFIGSMHACGVAITLTAASTVIFAEQNWTPGIMAQASDRAHRIGQLSSVLVQYLVVDGSIDVTMAQMIAEKGGVILEALDDIETTEDPEARLAPEQAGKDAVVAAALAAAAAQEAEEAKLAAEQEATRIEREARRAAAEVAYQAKRTEDLAVIEQLRSEFLARKAARATEERAASVRRAAAELGNVAPPSPEANAAIHACLRVLAELDPDRGTDRNGKGFSASDLNGHYLANLETLSDAEAIVGRVLTRRYQGQLDPETVAVAIGEPVRFRPATKQRDLAIDKPVSAADEVAAPMVRPTAVADAPEPTAESIADVRPEPVAIVEQPAADDASGSVAEPEPVVADAPIQLSVVECSAPGIVPAALDTSPTPTSEPLMAAMGGSRPRGRPRLGKVPMSPSERNRRSRELRHVVAMEVPLAVAERLRRMRERRGQNADELLDDALKALGQAETDAALAA